MDSTDNAETPAAVSPAQIAVLSVSILAILVFTSISIYLCGRRKGCNGCNETTTQQVMRRLSHHHLHHHHHSLPQTRIPPPSLTINGDQGTNRGRFTKLKEMFGIKAATAMATTEGEGASSDRASSLDKVPQMRGTSPLHIGVHHPGTGNPYSGTEEFQAAVHNLLDYRAGELQEWYPESDDDDVDDDNDAREGMQPEQHEVHSLGSSPLGSPLPKYEEVEEPRRFSWQGHESDYRPEKI